MRQWRTLFFVQFDENFSLDKLAQMCYNWPADAGRFGRNFGFVKYLENFSVICTISEHSSVFPEWTLCAGRARVRRPVFPPYTALYGFFLLNLAALYARPFSRKWEPYGSQVLDAAIQKQTKICQVFLCQVDKIYFKKNLTSDFRSLKMFPPIYYNIYFI